MPENTMSRNEALKILGLSSGATLSEAKTAYRKLSLKYHPDKNKSADAAEMFSKISNAIDAFEKTLNNDSKSSATNDASNNLKDSIAFALKEYPVALVARTNFEIYSCKIKLFSEDSKNRHVNVFREKCPYFKVADQGNVIEDNLKKFNLKIANHGKHIKSSTTVENIEVSNGDKTITIQGNVFSFYKLFDALRPVDMKIPENFNELMFAFANPEILKNLQSPVEVFLNTPAEKFANNEVKISPFFSSEVYLDNLLKFRNSEENLEQEITTEELKEEVFGQYGHAFKHFTEVGCALEITPNTEFDFDKYKVEKGVCAFTQCINEMLELGGLETQYCYQTFLK